MILILILILTSTSLALPGVVLTIFVPSSTWLAEGQPLSYIHAHTHPTPDDICEHERVSGYWFVTHTCVF
jgi:hypothetical protein